MKPLIRASSLALSAVVLAACSNEPVEPKGIELHPSSHFNLSGSPGLVLQPNSERYRDDGTKPATGRSGSASIMSRALLGRDGDVTVETTTGTLDDAATPPGALSKTQVKITLAGGRALDQTLNYNDLSGGGYQQLVYGGLARHSVIQVQASVRGIDANRTDVVTVQDTVALRPDLQAEITAPARAVAGTVVDMRGTISEINADVGATANCVLYIDGTAAAAATAIWVASGGAVDCAFSHVFSAVGTHHLMVAAENVVPGDYDTSNNTASADIEIYQPMTQMTASASAYQRIGSASASWTETDTQQYDAQYLATKIDTNAYPVDNSQNADLAAWTNHPIDFRTGVEYSTTTGGTTIDSHSLDPSADWAEGYTFGDASNGGRCIDHYEVGSVLDVCSYWTPGTDASGNQNGSTTVSYLVTASEVVYTTTDYSQTCDVGGCSSGQWYRSAGTTSTGNFVPFADDVTMHVRLLNGAVQFGADAQIPLTPSRRDYNSPYCYNSYSWYTGVSSAFCETDIGSFAVESGSVFVPGQ